MKKTIKIVIAHDHKILGQALVELLSAQPDFLVVAWVRDFTEAKRLACDERSDAIISAAYLADNANADSKPGELVVIFLKDGKLSKLAGYDEVSALSIEADLQDLYKLIRKSTLNDFSCLTTREREIFGLLAHGLSNQQIGRRLFITERTVKYHVSNVLRKLNAASRTEAAVKYLKAVG